MRGTYQHCKEKHLHRYLAEFDFRYNNRMALGVNDRAARRCNRQKASKGKRLTYRTTSGAWTRSMRRGYGGASTAVLRSTLS